MKKKLFPACLIFLLLSPLMSSAKIVFSSSRDGTGKIYVMNDDGSNVQRLTNTAFDDYSTRWISDGRQILFQRDFDPTYKLDNKFFIMDADGRNERTFMDNHPTDERPVMSPNGRHLAFVSERNGESDIYVRNMANGRIRQLTYNLDGRMSHRLDWSPDGRQIAYEHRAEPGDNIWIMNADGKQKKLFSPDRGDAPFLTGAPRWSPSGRYIAYPEMERTPDFKNIVSAYIVIQDVFTGHREKHLKGFLTSYAYWMGDDETLLISAEDYKDSSARPEIYRYNTNNRKLTNLTEGPGGGYTPDWISGPLAVFPADKLTLRWGELKRVD